MTIEKKIREKLFNSGLFPNQVDAVIEIMKKDKMNESMQSRWNDDESDYSPMIMALAWNAACVAAIEWIDANLPNAWYRPIFESK